MVTSYLSDYTMRTIRRRLKAVLLLSSITSVLLVSYTIFQTDTTAEKVYIKQHSSRHQLNVTSRLLKTYRIDWNAKPKGNPWEIADRWVTPRHILPEKAPQLGAVLMELSRRRIISADVNRMGSQLKLMLILEGEQRVVFKPKRYKREKFVNHGYDRHNGDIVVLHLSRLLRYRCAPLAVGRVIDLKQEIMPVATKELLAYFYKKGGNTCFYGNLTNSPGVCADGVRLEGSITMWLPNKIRSVVYPWRRSFEGGVRWMIDVGYCSYVKKKLSATGHRLLDLIDMAISDYLIGNVDRHHYEIFTSSGWERKSAVIMLDNSKSFGHPFLDKTTIVAPLYQCCMVRQQTYDRLLQLSNGTLSRVLRHLMAHDPIAPVISELHFAALDRRLGHIIEMIQNCTAKTLLIKG